MKYPKLLEIPASREMIDVFDGYNHNLRIGKGEFYDMTNLSSDNYPLLCPRGKRGIYESPEKPNGMIAKDVLCYVDGSDFVIGEDRIDMELTTDDSSLKTLTSMGAYVIIMPDKKYINTVPTKDENGNNVYEQGDIEETYSTIPGERGASYTQCKIDGSEYKDALVQDSAPTDTTMGWIDTNQTPHVRKEYSPKTNAWEVVSPTYIKLDMKGIDKFAPAGCDIVIENSSITYLKGKNKVWATGEDYIIITGVYSDTTVQDGNKVLTITRKMPVMDFMIECKNRLWGCRYGEAFDGSMVNEIYCSKLGDFKNWSSFQTISTDSWVASVGTDGPFTGAINYLGRPLFFKENHLHKVFGDAPSSFGIQDTACRGVQEGSSRSLAIVNETLFYKARSAVCAYDGSLPVEISSALGDTPYYNAVAGGIGNKYYISMADRDNNYNLFVFDTRKGLWHREDNTQAAEFCNYRGELYYINYDNRQIKTVRGTGDKDKLPVEWSAVTGIIGTDSPDKKYVSRMDVRMSLEIGSNVKFFMEYDSSGEWEYLFTMTGTKLGSFAVPIKPRRCDHMRLKIIGLGDAKIFSICKTIEQGSDL